MTSSRARVKTPTSEKSAQNRAGADHRAGKPMDIAIRDAARSLAATPNFHRLPANEREGGAVDALNLLGADGSDPDLVAKCADAATRISRLRGGSLLGRLRRTLTIYDRDLATAMGDISRPTVNAYIQGRLRENFDEKDRERLIKLIDERVVTLQGIKAELL